MSLFNRRSGLRIALLCIGLCYAFFKTLVVTELADYIGFTSLAIQYLVRGTIIIHYFGMVKGIDDRTYCVPETCKEIFLHSRL